MLQILLLAAAAQAAAPPQPAPATLQARSVVERQLGKRETAPPPPISAEEAARIQARYLQRIGAQLEVPSSPDAGRSGYDH